MPYEKRDINTEYTGAAGFVIVTVESSPQKRGGTARLLVSGPRPQDAAEQIAAASSADNFLEQVISSPRESMTAPVPSYVKWTVAVTGEADVQVLFIALHAIR